MLTIIYTQFQHLIPQRNSQAVQNITSSYILSVMSLLDLQATSEKTSTFSWNQLKIRIAYYRSGNHKKSWDESSRINLKLNRLSQLQLLKNKIPKKTDSNSTQRQNNKPKRKSTQHHKTQFSSAALDLISRHHHHHQYRIQNYIINKQYKIHTSYKEIEINLLLGHQNKLRRLGLRITNSTEQVEIHVN